MKNTHTRDIRQSPITTLAFLLMVTLMGVVSLISACTSQPQPPNIEEITFQSGSFRVVGDLRSPGGKVPYPVILIVHGSGSADRTSDGNYLPVFERMLRAGYAVFSWDKPGTGESEGSIEQGQVFKQRAQIVLDAIEVMKKRPDIDPERIGLAGISQAGYVMPRTLSLSEDIAFMVCISCPAIASVDQMAYQIAAQGTCAGVPQEQADQMSSLLTELGEARMYTTYDEYRQYRELLATMTDNWPNPAYRYRPEIVPEDAWQANDPEIENLWNPIRVIEQVKIPVLAFFGDRDTNIDPFQGALAYRDALERGGNPYSRVDLIPSVNHGMVLVETGCLDEKVQMGENGNNIIAPEFLDTLEEWLEDLP